jgi:SAM-dependent methyltransferase
MNELADHRSRMHAVTRGLIDSMAPRARELTGFDVYFEIRGVEFLLLFLKLSRIEGLSARRVLEIGCGIGFNLRLWAEVAEVAIGTDLPSEIERARRILPLLPASDGTEPRVVATAAEDLTGVEGEFDLVVSEYVLEHVRDLAKTLANIGERLAPGGHAVHVLPNVVDRHDWYVAYRAEQSALRRVRTSVADRGLLRTLKSPFEHTPPHEPTFGDFAREHSEYRLERWAMRMLEAGFEIVDFFSTRDVNTVLVTRRTAGP